MPAFYLHVRMDDEIISDLEGMDLPDLAAAKNEAIIGARAMMSDDLTGGDLNLDRSIEIHGPNGGHLASIEFSDALLIRVRDRRRLRIVPAT